MKTLDLIMKVLLNQNWGLFYRGKPIEQLTVQGDTPLFKVNEVSFESVEKALKETLDKEDTECKDTTQQSQGSQNTPLESG